MATPFSVHLVTPEREVWSGEATFVIARSASGDMGVLAGHEPVLSVLGIGPVVIERVNEPSLTAAVDGGFLSVSTTADGTTRVDVLAEHVTIDSDVTASEIAKLESEAQQLYQAGDESEARTAAAKVAVRRRIGDV